MGGPSKKQKQKQNQSQINNDTSLLLVSPCFSYVADQIISLNGSKREGKSVIMCSVAVIFGGGFLSGLLTLVALQALGVHFFIKRLNRKTHLQPQQQASHSSSPHQDLDPQQSLYYAFNKKGIVWVLESDKIPGNWPVEKVQKDQKRKREILEVTPIRKHANIKDRSLILTDSGGSHRAIPLTGCVIEAVSATSLPSRKWAQRFPIKVESKTSPIYDASKIVFIFVETSWEKESWCKALRLASSDDQEKLNWFTNLNEDFHRYLTSLNTGYPSFMKPSVGFYAEPIDRASRLDGSGSKVLLFWKKLARKAKTSVENKGTSLLGREERKINDKYHPSQDPAFAGSVGKNAPTLKDPITSEEENVALPSPSTFSRASSQSQFSTIDEGSLCWNLIISRLFFDAKSNAKMKSLAQAWIQGTLSNMRTPSYIGEVICTDLELGNLPPYIDGIRVLPTDMNEVWAWEFDIEYCGGVVPGIETRLEVRDLDMEKGVVNTDSGSSSIRDVSSDLLEDKLKDSKSDASTSTDLSRWKSILNSVAKQVLQVPLSLSIRVASLRGTVRLHIKPPPSDQLWFGFTSMPDVEFELESSVGEHKITSGQVASFLINKFKAVIRETMVLPNCESVCIPGMLAEKNDWVPRNAAPFIWINQEAASDNDIELELLNSQLDAKTNIEGSRGTSLDHPESKHQKAENVQQSFSDYSEALPRALSSIKPSMKNDKSSQDLTSPLLTISEAQETGRGSSGYISESQSPLSRTLITLEKQTHSVEEIPKKMGRRAKMLDLGKKMGEKFEEKRRHIEEKGRNIVDKMRGP
ncbi:hypothetical protein NC651_039305 [Populus alba x Populus x berolinensis]|nr:hypothetical protein NC651_039305 [Populus alba x Populus x berolinensis]